MPGTFLDIGAPGVHKTAVDSGSRAQAGGGHRQSGDDYHQCDQDKLGQHRAEAQGAPRRPPIQAGQSVSNSSVSKGTQIGTCLASSMYDVKYSITHLCSK